MPIALWWRVKNILIEPPEVIEGPANALKDFVKKQSHRLETAWERTAMQISIILGPLSIPKLQYIV